MFRLVTMLILIFFLLGVPQPTAKPLFETTVYTAGESDAEMGDASRPDPLRRFITAFRYAFRQSYILATVANRWDTIRSIPPAKEIIISIDNQRLYRFEDGRIISTYPVSTGLGGHRTPTGDFKVCRKSPKAWSRKYECMMLKWMAITSDGQYGIHALQGRSYLKRLGRPASHGCIRLSHDDADATYEWVDIGTPVTIVSEFDPAPYFATNESRVSTSREYGGVYF